MTSNPNEIVKASPVKVHRTLEDLLSCVRACDAHLPLGPRPIVQAGATARILVVGQAPGAKVHASGVPWDDKSGERLRDWMGVEPVTFYDKARIAILPMGYCYPGRAASGDLPPRRECADLWLDRLLAKLPQIELTLLVGQYAQSHFLRGKGHASVTATTASDTGHDLGADPNELVTITIGSDGTAALFSVLETAMAGERLGGVAIAEVSAVPEPETWATVFAGLGLMFAMRRRRAVS